MHNRLRMVTAMFLSAKNLLTDWRLGEAWFMAQLVDATWPPAVWRLAAGASPFSISAPASVRPLSQSRKSDPRGVSLREWLPELAHLDDSAIHDPSPMERAALGYPGGPSSTCRSWLRARWRPRQLRSKA